MTSKGPENPISSALTEGLKRKRGRPKKQPQEDAGNTAIIPQDAVEPQPAKKPRGRPKGSKKVTALTERTAEPAAGKRRRGRPRKWPQAVVQEGESQGGNPQESSDLNLNSAPATQVSSGAPAPISLPATELCADISGAAGSRRDELTSGPAAAAFGTVEHRPKPQPVRASLEKMAPGLAKPLVLGDVSTSLLQLNNVPPVHVLLKPEDWKANRIFNVLFQILHL